MVVLPILRSAMTVLLQQSRTGVVAEIKRLSVEERQLSDQRNELHAQIDALYLAAPLTSDEVAALDELEGLEFNLSSKRARLHQRIDDLRASIGLPPWRERHYDGDDEQAATEML